MLDLTRAVAAGLVVLYHARIYTVDDARPSGLAGMLLYQVTDCGTQAVFWFFVISGYLVGGAALAEIEAQRFSFRNYLVARFARLYIVLLPALALGGLLDGIRIASFGLNDHAGFETADSLSLPTLLGNTLFLETLAVPTFGSNHALWSLVCEFWYYLIFPLLLAPLMAGRSRAKRVLLGLAGAVLLLAVFFGNHSEAWLFVIWCLGVAARVWPWRLPDERLLWPLAIIAMLAWPPLHVWGGAGATLIVGLSFAAALAATERRQMPPWRYQALPRAFGAFSYSLYLIHLPILHIILTVAQQQSDPFLDLDAERVRSLFVILALATACYGAAYLFALGTEQHTPWLRRRLFLWLDRAGGGQA